MKTVPKPVACTRCASFGVVTPYAPYLYSYPMFPKNTLVALCRLCYKKLKSAKLNIEKEKDVLTKYTIRRESNVRK